MSDDNGKTLADETYDFGTPVTDHISLYAKWENSENNVGGDNEKDEGVDTGDDMNVTIYLMMVIISMCAAIACLKYRRKTYCEK